MSTCVVIEMYCAVEGNALMCACRSNSHTQRTLYDDICFCVQQHLIILPTAVGKKSTIASVLIF